MTTKPGRMDIGPLSPNGYGRHWVEPKHNFPAPRCNASSTGIFTGTKWALRPGAEDHKAFPSRGTGC